jgi:hypothetical protein
MKFGENKKSVSRFRGQLTDLYVKSSKESSLLNLIYITGGIRTPDRPLRRRMLYPAELL